MGKCPILRNIFIQTVTNSCHCCICNVEFAAETFLSYSKYYCQTGSKTIIHFPDFSSGVTPVDYYKTKSTYSYYRIDYNMVITMYSSIFHNMYFMYMFPDIRIICQLDKTICCNIVCTCYVNYRLAETEVSPIPKKFRFQFLNYCAMPKEDETSVSVNGMNFLTGI